MRILLSEHNSIKITRASFLSEEEFFDAIKTSTLRLFKTERKQKIYPFNISKISDDIFELKTDYYIGFDWIIEGKKYVQVEPKINTNNQDIYEEILSSEDYKDELDDKLDDGTSDNYIKELDYLKMLLDVYDGDIPQNEIKDLIKIHWNVTQIPIEQKKDDRLTPFIIVQFLNILKTIVRKGLKKSYYKVQENLNNRIKGKILLGQHIKKNIFKNKFTSAYCEYQVFGEDSLENRFLKKVFRFVISYVENNPSFLHRKEIEHIINFCKPAFESVNDNLKEDQLRNFNYNPFFIEYKEAIKIGNYILKRFSYTISNTTEQQISSPPFWIDMPKLFELYVYQKLLKYNNLDTRKILFQFSTYGNSLDFLINDRDNPMIIDAKYKLHYKSGQIHEDIRQVSGYARLKKVREKLCIPKESDRIIDCLIIYPDDRASEEFIFSIENIKNEMLNSPIPAYYKVWKLGIKLPTI